MENFSHTQNSKVEWISMCPLPSFNIHHSGPVVFHLCSYSLPSTPPILFLNKFRKQPFMLLLRFYLFIFRERGREGEGEGEKHECVVAFHTSPTRDPACNPSMCLDWELNWWPIGLPASTQSTKPHQPEPSDCLFCHHIFLVISLGLTTLNILYAEDSQMCYLH